MSIYDALRLKHLKELETQGIDPYSSNYNCTCFIGDIKENIELFIDKKVIIIGRITYLHLSHKLLEGIIEGGKVELNFRISSNFKLNNYLDIGDIIQLFGKVEKNHSIQLNASKFNFITKSLRKYPSKENWLKNLNKRRYHYEISLLLNNEVMDIFINRCKTLIAIREFLWSKGFFEVDSPILLHKPVMAPVKDFVTTEPEFNKKTFLRISNTDFMRKYLISGKERIFHIGKFFRDEPLSFKRYFEFTMLTFGLSYTTYYAVAELIEEITQFIIDKIYGGRRLLTFKKKKINFKRPWKKITMRDAVNEYANIDIEENYEEEALRSKMLEKGIPVKDEDLHIDLIERLLDSCILPHLTDPTYITEFPHFFGGPAKEVPNNPKFKQRCELFINGVEIANMSTHQNNPIKLRFWFENTLRQKEKRGWERQEIDEDYFFPMEIGSPPCASGAIGVDRLLMVLMNIDHILDVVPFSSSDLP